MKTQWGTTNIRMTKFETKNITTDNIKFWGGCRVLWSFDKLLVKMQNDKTSLEIFVISCKHTVAIQPRNLTYIYSGEMKI